MRRQQAEEDEIKKRFPNLEESVLLSRIHETRFLDNRISNRGDGFVVDQKILSMHRAAHQEVVSDFTRVATAINVALAEAFGHESKNQSTVIQAVRDRVHGHPWRVCCSTLKTAMSRSCRPSWQGNTQSRKNRSPKPRRRVKLGLFPLTTCLSRE